MKQKRKFRKKPVVIEAQYFDGTSDCAKTIGLTSGLTSTGSVGFFVDTLEGKMLASPGDWVITGVKGEMYPCKPDVFYQTYEEVL